MNKIFLRQNIDYQHNPADCVAEHNRLFRNGAYIEGIYLEEVKLNFSIYKFHPKYIEVPGNKYVHVGTFYENGASLSTMIDNCVLLSPLCSVRDFAIKHEATRQYIINYLKSRLRKLPMIDRHLRARILFNSSGLVFEKVGDLYRYTIHMPQSRLKFIKFDIPVHDPESELNIAQFSSGVPLPTRP